MWRCRWAKSLYSMPAWCPLLCSLVGLSRASFITSELFSIGCLHSKVDLRTIDLFCFSYSTLFELYAFSSITHALCNLMDLSVPVAAEPLTSYSEHYPPSCEPEDWKYPKNTAWRLQSFTGIIKTSSGLAWVFLIQIYLLATYHTKLTLKYVNILPLNE